MHPILQELIIFSENIINVLVIENSNFFSKLIEEIYQQLHGIEGDFVFSENNVPIDCLKSIEILFNIFELDINCKKIINKLNNQLSNNAIKEDNYLDTLNIKGQIIKYIDKICSTEMYQIKYSTEFDIVGLFKLVDVKLESSYTSVTEKVIDYLTISYEFFHYNCFIFVNLKSFVSNEDLKKIYSFVQYNKINILLLENRISSNVSECEKILIIDEDLCII